MKSNGHRFGNPNRQEPQWQPAPRLWLPFNDPALIHAMRRAKSRREETARAWSSRFESRAENYSWINVKTVVRFVTLKPVKSIITNEIYAK